jgi:nicotinamidase-related amidase
MPKFSFPPDWTDLVPELEEHPTDHLVTKQSWGAFANTGLDDYLRLRGVTQIVMAGVATSAGVESTARNAYDFGYTVTFATDAMTDRDIDMHRACIEKIFPRIGEVALADDVLNLLPNAD